MYQNNFDAQVGNVVWYVVWGVQVEGLSFNEAYEAVSNNYLRDHNLVLAYVNAAQFNHLVDLVSAQLGYRV